MCHYGIEPACVLIPKIEFSAITECIKIRSRRLVCEPCPTFVVIQEVKDKKCLRQSERDKGSQQLIQICNFSIKTNSTHWCSLIQSWQNTIWESFVLALVTYVHLFQKQLKSLKTWGWSPCQITIITAMVNGNAHKCTDKGGHIQLNLHSSANAVSRNCHWPSNLHFSASPSSSKLLDEFLFNWLFLFRCHSHIRI